MKIGYVGNFSIPWTTENERAWSFRKLGHEVVEFQENKTKAGQLIEAADSLDVLLYSHTHDPSWEIDGLTDVLKTYKEKGVPTASVHLDVFAGLARETDVGREAMWHCEHVFSADGSPEAAKLYDSKGVNWHYLKPGVVERDVYMAKPDREKFPFEIVFVGSRNYHKEYPFRPLLVDWLKDTYGDRFGHYGSDGIRTVRGDELNTLYASSKIAIGDSCFGGRHHYLSDRYMEAPARSAFLIHPWVDEETTENPGVVHYEKGNFVELMEKIDFFLTADDERERFRKKGHEWVKEHGTYTVRSQEMLEVIFGKDNK